MKATRVANYEEAVAHGPGAFWYHFDENGKPTNLTFVIPNAVKDEEGKWTDPGCYGALGSISLRPARPGGWDFDGNLDAPTCSPSIWVNMPRGWHGHLRNGEFIGA